MPESPKVLVDRAALEKLLGAAEDASNCIECNCGYSAGEAPSCDGDCTHSELASSVAEIRKQINQPVAIRYRILPDGGFLVGDEKTGMTGYAPSGSLYAGDARINPHYADIVAEVVIQSVRTVRHTCTDEELASAAGCDEKNWKLMRGEVQPS